MQQINVLFTSSGRRVSLVNSFSKAIKDLGLAGKVVTADMSKLAATAFVSDVHELVPAVQSGQYIARLLEICSVHQIKLLIPLIDTELVLLAENKPRFDALGTTVLVSSVDTNLICFDKRKSGQFFAAAGFDIPRLIEISNALDESNSLFPMFLKPASGSSSVGATRIRNAHELSFFSKYISDPVLQEFLTGEEYTLDILTDFSGKVVSVVPRLRIEARAGEVSKGMTTKNQRIIEFGRKVVGTLPGAFGCLTVQCFLTPDERIVLIEINPRFGGGFPLAFHAGADFPRWILQMLLGKFREPGIDNWADGVVMLRYDDAVFTHRCDVE